MKEAIGLEHSTFAEREPSMDKDKQAKIAEHARAIAAMLYEETDPEQVKTLAGIEEAVRAHLLEHISPEIASFLSKQVAVPKLVEGDASTVSSDSSN